MRSTKNHKRSRAGFTLVEMLVVIGITTVLSAVAITYSHTGQNEVSLSVETSKIAELILQAKEFSIATYKGPQNACAYGIHFDFDAQTYSLFAFGINGSAKCPSLSSTTALGLAPQNAPSPILESSPDSWQIPVALGVVLESPTDAFNPHSDELSDVLFYPPAPTTLMSRDSVNFLSPAQTSFIYLKTADGKNTAIISVSPAGQVNF